MKGKCGSGMKKSNKRGYGATAGSKRSNKAMDIKMSKPANKRNK